MPCRTYSNSRRSASRLHRQCLGSALQPLNAGHLADRYGVRVLLRGGRRRLVDRADVGALSVEFGVRLGRQPIAVAARLAVRAFLKGARPNRARYSGRCPGSPQDGRVRSGSSDLIGTSGRSGSSQASVMIWQICSGVKVAGARIVARRSIAPTRGRTAPSEASGGASGPPSCARYPVPRLSRSRPGRSR